MNPLYVIDLVNMCDILAAESMFSLVIQKLSMENSNLTLIGHLTVCPMH